MALPRILTAPVGVATRAAGNVASAVPGLKNEGQRLQSIGNSIYDPNVNYTGALNPLSSNFKNTGGAAWATQPNSGPQVAGSYTTDQPSGSGNEDPATLGWSTGGSGGARATAGGGSMGYTAEDIAGLESQVSQIDRLLASLGVTRDTGLQNIGREYEKNVGRANEEQNAAMRDFNIRRSDNETQKSSMLNRINTRAENNYNGLQRTLGLAGAGVSSASRILAPQAVSREASQDRSEQFDTYGRNARSIDVAQGDTERKYKNLLEDLLGQRNSRENEFRQSMIGQENDLYGTRATAQSQLAAARGGNVRAPINDYTSRFNNNQNLIDNLLRQFVTPAYNYKAVDTTAPNLSQYTLDRQAIQAGQMAQDPTATEVNPYLPFLQDKDQRNGLL